MRAIVQAVLALLVCAAGGLGAWQMLAHRIQAPKKERVVLAPLVRVQELHERTLQLVVRTQGTVVPRTESQLVAEVPGRVVSVSPSLASGGFFETGEILITLDKRDFELARIRARAEVARAEMRLAQETAEAESARKAWQQLGKGKASPLVLREPQLEEARADVAAARASLQQAELDLERTKIRAPFAGRVRQKHVDVGQFVIRGATLARIYAVDYAEVRLPLPDKQLAFLDLPLDYREDKAMEPDAPPRGPKVKLIARFAGKTYEWPARIVRTEGEIDHDSRVVHVIARVDDPYGRSEATHRPPLAVGMFVAAEISGRTVQHAFVIPRAAVRAGGRVLLVDADNRLRFRSVSILRRRRQDLVIDHGLANGERLCLSPLETATEGMRVQPTVSPPEKAGR